MPKPADFNPWRYFSLGLEFAVAVLVFGLIGWWIDGWLGTLPWGVLIGVSVGCVGGMYRFIQQARQAIRESQIHPPNDSRTDDHSR